MLSIACDVGLEGRFQSFVDISCQCSSKGWMHTWNTTLERLAARRFAFPLRHGRRCQSAAWQSRNPPSLYWMTAYVAVGQNQWYHFGVGAPGLGMLTGGTGF